MPSYSQVIRGKVMDQQDKSIPFANVVFLNDSCSFVTGCTTDEDGIFTLDWPKGVSSLVITYIGYKEKTLPLRKDRSDLGIIQIEEDTHLLREVVVKGDLPKTRIKGEAMVTNVAGSLLEKAGTAIDVLGKVPGLRLEGGRINVFGRGTPQIYINGKEVSDASELTQLTSDNIRAVEVITNPGVKYDKTVRAVVRIQTKKAADDGFGFSERANMSYNDEWSYLNQLNLYCRRGKLDMSGMLYYSDQTSWRRYDGIQQTYLDHYWEQQMKADQLFKDRSLTASLTLNYTLSPKHVLGATYRFRRYPRNKSEMMLETDITQDDSFWENSLSDIRQDNPETRHEGNIYYKGKIGEWDIDFNGTGIHTTEKVTTQTVENIRDKEENEAVHSVHTFADTHNKLYAGKLILSYLLWEGTFSIGGEYSHTSRSSLYRNREGIVADDDSRIKEGLVGTFAEYERIFGRVSLQGGVRFENVAFDYYQSDVLRKEQSKNYNNVFPALSVSMPVDKVQLQLSYTSDISRPGYQMLRNRVDYVNRYTYESGNPFLQPALTHTIALKASYKWLLFYADWNHLKDAIIPHSESYSGEDPTIALMKPLNAPSYNAVNIMLNASPTIGCWSPQVNLDMYKQWFKVEKPGVPGETLSLNKPSFSGSWENAFELPFEIVLNTDIYWQGRTERDNAYYKSMWFVNASLYKDFFDSRLTFLLQANDIFDTNRYDLFMYYGHLRTAGMDQKYSRQSITLTVQYRFNAKRSKYKGTGAGDAQKYRL